VRILVTGGAGYLGSEVARLGVEHGCEVLATRLQRDPPHGRPVRLDIRDENDTARVFLKHGPQVVIHTAYRQADEEVWGAVVKGTHSVALAARRSGARLIHLSTDLVFDGGRAGRYDEDDEPRPVSLYGDAKLAAERIVRENHPEALIVRTSLLYGKPGPQEALALRDDIAFYTDEVRTPARVDEVASALLELAATELDGVLHVAGADAVSRYELARLLAAAQGRDPGEIRGEPTPPGAVRPRNVALDSSRAAGILRVRLRGATEVLHSL
jgi:dTDP-4-dehydrorhamnose reductase